MESKEEEVMQCQSNKEDDGNEPHQVEKSIDEDSAARLAAANEVLIIIPGAVLNLVDKKYSMPLARGDLCITRLSQEDKIVSTFVRVADQFQSPLTKQGVVVKLDGSHYFFTIPPSADSSFSSPSSDDDDEKKENKKEEKNKDKSTDDDEEGEDNEILNIGLTINEVEDAGVLKQFEEILKMYSCFSEEKVSEQAKKGVDTIIEKSSANRSWGEDEEDTKEKKCAVYWTAMAPNVYDYSSTFAKLIASGSGIIVDNIQWCGDVTVSTLNWVNQLTEKRMHTKSKSQINPSTLRRIRRVKRLTRNTEKVVTGVLSGVVKLTSSFSRSVLNSSVGKKFVYLPAGEAIVASLDAFNKVFDAVEEAGGKIMTTSSSVTTQLVQRRYGDAAAEVTGEGLGAAGHVLGTARAAFSVRKALNPVSVLKPKTKEVEEEEVDKRNTSKFKPRVFAKSAAKAVGDMTAKYYKK